MMVNEFLKDYLPNAGYAGVQMAKSPMGTRINIKAARPGIVIGKRGGQINDLGHILSDQFKVENPQIKITPVKVPELNGQIMAERLAYGLEKGENFRRTTYAILRRIMKCEARGAEISVSGKVTSQRARHQVFRIGVLPKAGEPSIAGISRGYAKCILKTGVLGIVVKISPNSYQMPDEIVLKDEKKVRKANIRPNELLKIEEEIDEEAEEIISELEDEEEIDASLFDKNEESQEQEIKAELSEIEEFLEEKAPEPPAEAAAPEKKKSSRARKPKSA